MVQHFVCQSLLNSGHNWGMPIWIELQSISSGFESDELGTRGVQDFTPAGPALASA